MQFRQVPAAIPAGRGEPSVRAGLNRFEIHPMRVSAARQGPMKESGLAPSNPLGAFPLSERQTAYVAG